MRWKPFLVAAGVLCLAALYARIALEGFGNDNDTYRMLATWQILVKEGRYEPSRFQGYLLPELAIGFSASRLGHVGSNLLSVLMGGGSLLCLYLLGRRVGEARLACALTALAAANPHWILASTTSTDYMYGMFFFLCGVWLLSRETPVLAAVSLAASVSSRITYLPMALGALLVAGLLRDDARWRKRTILASVTCGVLSCLLYLPVFVASGYSLGFLDAASPTSGGILGRLARVGYKSLYLFGVPTTVTLLVYAVSASRAQAGRRGDPWKLLRAVFVAVALYQLCLFVFVPAETAYLLPVVPAVAGLLMLARPGPLLLSVLIALQLSYGWVKIELLDVKYRSEGPAQATIAESARPTLGLKPGVLLEDLRKRSRYQAYYEEQMSRGRLPVLFEMSPPDQRRSSSRQSGGADEDSPSGAGDGM